MGVYCARGGKILVTPNLVEKTVTAERFSGMTKKVLKQLKLLARKLDAMAATQHLVTAQVDLNIAKRVAVLLFRQSVGAPENGFDASEEFANGEGFGDVVVGAEFQPHDLIDFLATRRKH